MTIFQIFKIYKKSYGKGYNNLKTAIINNDLKNVHNICRYLDLIHCLNIISNKKGGFISELDSEGSFYFNKYFQQFGLYCSYDEKMFLSKNQLHGLSLKSNNFYIKSDKISLKNLRCL